MKSLSTESEIFIVHKAMLTLHSPRLKTCIENNSSTNVEHIDLRIHPEVFDVCLKWMYSQSLKATDFTPASTGFFKQTGSNTRLWELWGIAADLEIPALERQCLKQLETTRMDHKPDLRTVNRFYDPSRHYPVASNFKGSYNFLKKAMVEWYIKDWLTLIQQGDYISLRSDFLKEIIKALGAQVVSKRGFLD